MNLVQTYSQKQFQCCLDSWNFKCTVYSRSFKTYYANICCWSVCHVYVSIESQSKALGNAQPLPHERDYPRGRVLILSSQSSSISPRSSSVCPSGCFIVQVEANERRREKSPLVSKMLVKHLKVFPTRWSTKSLSDLVKQSVKPSTALPRWAFIGLHSGKNV